MSQAGIKSAMQCSCLLLFIFGITFVHAELSKISVKKVVLVEASITVNGTVSKERLTDIVTELKKVVCQPGEECGDKNITGGRSFNYTTQRPWNTTYRPWNTTYRPWNNTSYRPYNYTTPGPWNTTYRPWNNTSYRPYNYTTVSPWYTTQRPWNNTSYRPYNYTTNRPWNNTYTTGRPWYTTERPWNNTSYRPYNYTTNRPWNNTYTTGRPWYTTQRPWNNTSYRPSNYTTNRPWNNTYTTERPWYTTNRPWNNTYTTERPWYTTNRPWNNTYTTGRPWYTTNRPWNNTYTTERPWYTTNRPWNNTYTTERPWYTTQRPWNNTSYRPSNYTTNRPWNNTSQRPHNYTTERPWYTTPYRPYNYTTQRPWNATLDCSDLPAFSPSGVYRISTAQGPMEVYCDMKTDGGNWTVIQNHNLFSGQYLDKTWKEYRDGFGTIKEAFWLGNNVISAMTSRRRYSLRVDMSDLDGNNLFAKYSYFYVEPEAEKFRLNVSGFSGNVVDALSYHTGSYFSTRDMNNDFNREALCSDAYGGGWWYASCFQADLNGYQPIWTGTKLLATEMKIRPDYL